MNKKNNTPVEGNQNRSTISSIERHISGEIAKHDWSIQLKIALACRKLASEEHAQTLAGHVTVRAENNTFWVKKNTCTIPRNNNTSRTGLIKYLLCIFQQFAKIFLNLGKMEPLRTSLL